MSKGKCISREWLERNYPTMTDIHSLLDAHESEFGWRPTKTAVYVKANRLGIRKKPVSNHDGRAERTVRWSREPEMETWMLEHDHGQRSDQLSHEFRERFGFGLCRSQITAFRSSHGTRTRAGHSGGRPRVPVGTERLSSDGYIIVKYREDPIVPTSKDNWKLKHVLVWEEHNGPLPDGHMVFFADGNKRNFDAENLVAVPRRLVGVMNGLGVKWHDRDTLIAVMMMAEIRCARNSAISKEVRTCPWCGKEYDNTSRRQAGNVAAGVCPECGAAGRKPPHVGYRKYDHDEIRRLHELGYRNEEVAATIGCSRTTVSNAIHHTSEQRKELRRSERNGTRKESGGNDGSGANETNH